MTNTSHIIVGTAGHIDHGKTTLVHALTGSFLDRTPEEQKRGITIHLGFTHRLVASKQKDKNDLYMTKCISFIDVPGHENLIQTMIAGASGIDVVLFCVSAVDSVMPQTIEHLQILQFLGITNGIIAITQADLADEEMIDFVIEDIKSVSLGTFLENAPIVIFRDLHTFAKEEHSPKKHVAVPQIEEILEHIVSFSPRIRDIKKAFRLYLDRSFSLKGHGTIVTGTITSGEIRVGESISIAETTPVKIRHIEVHGSSVEQAFAGQRVALNLSNVHIDQLPRGTLLQRTNTIPSTQMIDILYTYVDKPLEQGMSVRFLSASFDVIAKVYEYEEPIPENYDEENHSQEITHKTSKKQQYLQLRTQSPIFILAGDRFLIRNVSPNYMLGGGFVLDPYPPKCQKKSRHEQCLFLTQLHELFDQIQVFKSDITETTKNMALIYVERHKQNGMDKKKGDVLFSTFDSSDILCFHQKYYTQTSLTYFIEVLEKHIGEFHKKYPLRSGVLVHELHSLSVGYLGKEFFYSLIQIGCEQNIWIKSNNRVHLSAFRIHLSSENKKEIDACQNNIYKSGLEGVVKTSNISNPYLDYLIQEEIAVIIDNRLIHAKHLVTCIQNIQNHFEESPELQTMDFKEITNLSRKYAIPLLEWCDHQSITKRQENHRVKGESLFSHTLLNKIG